MGRHCEADNRSVYCVVGEMILFILKTILVAVFFTGGLYFWFGAGAEVKRFSSNYWLSKVVAVGYFWVAYDILTRQK